MHFGTNGYGAIQKNVNPVEFNHPDIHGRQPMGEVKFKRQKDS